MFFAHGFAHISGLAVSFSASNRSISFLRIAFATTYLYKLDEFRHFADDLDYPHTSHDSSHRCHGFAHISLGFSHSKTLNLLNSLGKFKLKVLNPLKLFKKRRSELVDNSPRSRSRTSKFHLKDAQLRLDAVFGV